MRVRKHSNKRLKSATKFIIDRSHWRVGGGTNVHEELRDFYGHDTELLDDNGNMCCLGFYAHACGYGKEHLLGEPYLSTLTGDAGDTFDWIGGDETDFMLENDGDSNFGYGRIKTFGEREKAITKLFKQHGVEVTFVGEYPKELQRIVRNGRKNG